MQTLGALQRRIERTKDLHSVVKSMKALAAASIRQYEHAADAVGEWGQAIDLALQVALRNSDAKLKEVLTPLGRETAAIVIGSDQGMCGQFNDDIASLAIEKLARDAESTAGNPKAGDGGGGPSEPEDTDDTRPRILAIGERVAARLQDAGLRVSRRVDVPPQAEGIARQAGEALVQAERWRSEHAIQRIRLFHNRRLSASRYRPEETTLWPLDLSHLRHLVNRPWHSRSLPIARMNRDRLLAGLIRQYLFVTMFRALAESAASEQASRLTSMQAAEQDIEDRLDDLTQQHNQQRQQAITGELLDLVSGRVVLED